MLLGLLQGELSKLYDDKDVCKWLAKFPALITPEILNLARYICINKIEKAYGALQLTRLVGAPTNIPSFITTVKYFLASDKSDWVEDCLNEIPSQMKLDLKEF